ncbi:hypothetical protein A3E39_00695 [Candidatus Uhrbacteria bacterium RIFCSPHIGHO2_12_FULL_60_25]|uniref:Response regulatory domain-containing protein n=1 Tax=Candidatus Uhrbacteria bacterium RIFCSPHIGHO2_12_FULL_60_25 TaxID=1802399 RepID=A0A1F7UPJ9_9BACT|nr:MAG: hypothetical protein A3D73_03305 [Candidatus Uhrbacteria bacterium RIFCSPHIGHO2_02_FULL_60_44]OGL79627.1 MAG: hypothetical protein A3E39_00695 [Candidatus Uhrbacteria bacterium RIFCSPHIGHO2_12_FULL_60_25]
MAKTRLLIIVDDEPGLARGIARYIRQFIPRSNDPAVCRVQPCEHPKAALELIRSSGHDASVFLITDGHMPYLNGDEFILELRAKHPDALRYTCITSCHRVFDELAKGIGVEFMYGKAVDQVHWPRIKKAIEDFLAN